MPEVTKKQVGVLGASSLVGACLLQRLVQNSWPVIAFSRQVMVNRPLKNVFEAADARQKQAKKRSLCLINEHSEPVLNAAAATRIVFQRPVKSDAGITWRLLDNGTQTGLSDQPEIALWICVAPIWTLPEHFDFLLAQGVRRIIALSSTSRFTKDNSSDSGEQAVAHRLIASEEHLQAWATRHGVEWIILRPTLIYGLGQDKNIAEITRFIRRFGFFPLLGSAYGLRQPIHVEDVAMTCFNALIASNIVNRAYNLTGSETLSYREMVNRVFTALNRAPRFVTIPRWIFQFAIKGLRWLPRYRHWTTAMADRMNRDLVFDCADARLDLNFSPRLFKLEAKDLSVDI